VEFRELGVVFRVDVVGVSGLFGVAEIVLFGLVVEVEEEFGI
jgi:hypothetical protein